MNTSQDELKIRGELEMDVERDLEEEIKEEIYHLALRLHRLYRHQKERSGEIPMNARRKTLSEVNINIKMEGGTKIEIKEIKREAREKGMSRLKNSQGVHVDDKKFDWMKSLRGGAGPSSVNKKLNIRSTSKLAADCYNLYHNTKYDDNGRRSTKNTFGQQKAEVKLPELGWKY